MNLHDPKIPVIGAPYKIFATHFCVGLECNCEMKGQMVLFGNGSMQSCPACGTIWILEKVEGLPNGQFGAHIRKMAPTELAAMQTDGKAGS